MEDTLFYLNLKKNPQKIEIFQNAFEQGLIQFFDPDVLTKLRKMYYGCYSGLLYLYTMPTDSSSIGSKLEILSHVFSDLNYVIVHGHTDSTREICFSDYNSSPLDYNSWIEVASGLKIWVYDVFSMLKFERDTYYQLENPFITKKVPFAVIRSFPEYYDTDFSHLRDPFILISLMRDIECNVKLSPYRSFLEAELEKFKIVNHYQDILLQWEKEKKMIK